MTNVTFVHGDRMDLVKDILILEEVPRVGDCFDWPDERYQIIGVVWTTAVRLDARSSAVAEMRRLR